MMIKTFDKYSHQELCEKIYRLRMDLDELVDDFCNWFLHLCCEIPD